MSNSTDVNGVKTVWSKEDRWSGSSSELANFIKWLKDHAEGDIKSFFYLQIIEGKDLFNLIPSTNATAPTYKTSSGNPSTEAPKEREEKVSTYHQLITIQQLTVCTYQVLIRINKSV